MSNIVKFLVRRGLNQDRLQVLLADGELGYTRDGNSHRLFVGDGANLGGWPVASKFYFADDWFYAVTLNFVEPNDVVFIRSESTLYALLSGSPSVSANYVKIAPKVT
jgi:hypothetical protein